MVLHVFLRFLARAFWQTQAKDDLRKAKTLRQNIGVAKNVIIFLGDGMGVSTVTAARILKGQLENKTGEESVLSFETFPYVGLSKVIDIKFSFYNVWFYIVWMV